MELLRAAGCGGSELGSVAGEDTRCAGATSESSDNGAIGDVPDISFRPRHGHCSVMLGDVAESLFADMDRKRGRVGAASTGDSARSDRGIPPFMLDMRRDRGRRSGLALGDMRSESRRRSAWVSPNEAGGITTGIMGNMTADAQLQLSEEIN